MKKLITKTVSILLCAIIGFSVMTCAVSAQSPSTNTSQAVNTTPVVIVPGIGMSKTTLFDDDENVAKNPDGSDFAQWTVFNLDTSEVMNNLWKLIPSLLASIVLQHDIGLTGLLAEYFPSLFKYAAHNPDGSSIENVKAIERNYPLSEYDKDTKHSFYKDLPIDDYVDQLGEENMYVFNFPAFSNTYEEAENLREYIKMVKASTGKEQVILLPLSLGGTIVSAYFDAYKDDRDVCKIINVVAALDGSDIIGDVLACNYADNADELLYNKLMPELLGKPTGYIVNIALHILPRKLSRQIVDTCMDGIIKTVIVNTPTMWSLVPSERYLELADKWLSDEEHAYIRTLTDKYYNAQKNLAARVEELTEDYNIDIYNICGCDLNFGKGWSDYQYFRFFASSEGSNSDGIIQISSTGMGTDSVPAGETYPTDHLPDATIYCTNKCHNHICGSINASTCYLPERTWYFLDQHHEIAYNNVAVKLICKIILGEIDDIYTTTDFPQFNGSRNVKKLVRNYIPTAKKLDRTKLDESQKVAIDTALQNAYIMLDSTVANSAQCNQITQEMYEALVLCGVIKIPKEASAFDKLKLNLLIKINKIIHSQIGPRGFSDAVFGRTFD